MFDLLTYVFVTACALPTLTRGASLPSRSLAAPKAIYYMINEGPNAIASIPVAKDGTLTTPISTTLTGGQSGAQIDAKTGGLASPDALGSAGSLQVIGQNLFAVNPGSNTVSMFRIDRRNATKLTLLGEPQHSNGDFPVSIAVSPKNRLVCVANQGAANGIACASYSSSGLAAFDQLRNFNLNVTTPPVGLNSTISQPIFDNAEKVLYTTVKGQLASNPTGFLSASRVVRGQVSYDSTRSSPEGIALLFGVTTIPGSADILAADFTFGAEVISINSQLQGSSKGQITVPGNKANCWTTYSSVSNTGFTTDAGTNQIAEYDTSAGSLITAVRPPNSNSGMNDVIAVGKWLYVLSPNKDGNATGITVFDVSGGKGSIKQIQAFIPGGAHNRAAGLGWST